MCIKTIDFLQDDCIRGSTMKVAGLIKSTHYSFSFKGAFQSIMIQLQYIWSFQWKNGAAFFGGYNVK